MLLFLFFPCVSANNIVQAKHTDCGPIWQLSKFSKNLDFSHNFWKSRFLSKVFEIISVFVEFLIISYLDQISDNLDFVQNFRKITISLKIFNESRFWSKLIKISILINIYRKSLFLTILRKISILVKIFEISQFWSNYLTKNSNFVKFSEKFRLRKKSSKYLDCG